VDVRTRRAVCGDAVIKPRLGGACRVLAAGDSCRARTVRNDRPLLRRETWPHPAGLPGGGARDPVLGRATGMLVPRTQCQIPRA
jgi:hypothetical protein